MPLKDSLAPLNMAKIYKPRREPLFKFGGTLMKITGMEAITVNVQYIETVRKYRPEGRQSLILKIHTDEGIVGLGEAYAGREDEERLKGYAKGLLGRDPMELNLADLWSFMPGIPSYAFLGFEMALYDILGKKLGLPVCKLLGGRFRDWVPLAYWSHEMTVEETVSEALVAVEKGFKVYKFKAWERNYKGSVVERVKAIDKAVGDGLALRLEANWAWENPARAMGIIRKLEGYNIECLEDPVPYNLEWYRLLRRKTSLPIAIHFENGSSYPRPREILNALKAEACDYMNIAGPDFHEGFLKGAAIADMAGVRIWHGGHLAFAIMDAAFAHACGAVKNDLLPCDLLHHLFEDDLILKPLKFKDGFLEVPKGPGLGIELDDEAVKRHEIRRVEVKAD
ncbi:MAG: mandelate racemase/muconate lactonizing enzyme family protein [Candidatus Bathyarchaeia archaeon]